MSVRAAGNRSAAQAASSSRREISIANRHPRLRFKRRAVAQAIALLDRNPSVFGRQPRSMPAGELSLVFLPDAELAQLHGEFLNDPSHTDVVTFEGDPTMGTAGEICVSADTAARYARERSGDFSRELTLYLVHGWLHLAGFDDLVPEKKRAMRRAEARALRLLERSRAIPQFSFHPAARRGRAHK